MKDFKPITYKEKEIVEPYTKPTLLKKIDVSAETGIESKKEEAIAEEERITIAKNKTSTIDDKSKNEKSKDKKSLFEETIYTNYELKIREMIRSVIEKNCKRIPKEGDVSVRFVIDRNGNIKEIALYETSKRGMKFLENIATRSIKEASPFPPFDDEMKEKELPLILPIRFSRH